MCHNRTMQSLYNMIGIVDTFIVMSCHFSCVYVSDLVFNSYLFMYWGISSRTKLGTEEKTLLQTFIFAKEISGSSLASSPGYLSTQQISVVSWVHPTDDVTFIAPTFGETSNFLRYLK